MIVVPSCDVNNDRAPVVQGNTELTRLREIIIIINNYNFPRESTATGYENLDKDKPPVDDTIDNNPARW
jgi:hypothetical protein